MIAIMVSHFLAVIAVMIFIVASTLR